MSKFGILLFLRIFRINYKIRWDKNNNLKGELLNTFSNRREASTKLNIYYGYISACCKDKYKTAGGLFLNMKEIHLIYLIKLQLNLP